MAQGAREGVSEQSMGNRSGKAVQTLPVHGLSWNSDGKEEGLVLLHGSLPNYGPWDGNHGLVVTGIGIEAHQPVYDITVEDAHCFLIGPGIYAHNCVDSLLYLLMKNRTDIGAKQIDMGGINAARLSRFGEFGVW